MVLCPWAQVEYASEVKGTTGKDMQVGFKAIKAKCDRLNVAHPTTCCVDDCCAQRNIIQDVFPKMLVVQDLKHLVNRMINNVSVTHVLYGDFCKKLHGALVGDNITVQTRNGAFVEIAGRLLPKEEQESKLVELVSHYKSISGGKLFLGGFDDALDNQLEHIRKGCLVDPIIDGKHYVGRKP
jgi:hypothetical protein